MFLVFNGARRNAQSKGLYLDAGGKQYLIRGTYN